MKKGDAAPELGWRALVGGLVDGGPLGGLVDGKVLGGTLGTGVQAGGLGAMVRHNQARGTPFMPPWAQHLTSRHCRHDSPELRYTPGVTA